MKRTINLNDKMQLISKVILFVSIIALSLFCSPRCEKEILLIGMILVAFISFYLVKYKLQNIFEKIDILYLAVSFFISNYIMRIYYNFHFDGHQGDFFGFPYWPLTILTIFGTFALIIFVYLGLKKLVPIIKKFIKSLTKFEKWYLIIIFIVAFVLTYIIYNITTAFYYSPVGDYDILYTSDSAALLKGDAFFNINMVENDLRQPLFGLLAMPFAFLAKVFSDIFFFVANGYAVFLTTIQITLLGFTVLMLTRLLKFNSKQKLNYIILYFSAFSTLAFAFILEQYIIALFYLILMIYVYYQSKLETNYTYIGSVGTLLTSGICLPFISKTKNIKTWFKSALKCAAAFLGIMLIAGQLDLIVGAIDNFKGLMNYGGDKLSFIERFEQFLAFIQSIFLGPDTRVIQNAGYLSLLLEKVNGFSIIGIIVLIICLISLIINRKNKMAIVSGLWILFSFALLCVMGWGTNENGLILYSLYFSWAFIILIYLFIDKLIKNDLIKRIIIIILCISIFVFNIPAFLEIAKFGIVNYPA